MSASLSQFFKPRLNFIDDGSKKDNYVVEVSFEAEKEENEGDKKREILKEEDPVEDPKVEEREVFVDTSEKAIDEEPQADTEKIGEAGSIARDMYAGSDNVNNEPRLTDDADNLVVEPEYLTTVSPLQAEVPVELQVNVIPPVQEEIENSLPDEAVHEEIAQSVIFETSEEAGDKADVREIEETDTIVVTGEKVEKSIPEVIEGDATDDPNDQEEGLGVDVSVFDSDVIVPENKPVKENLEEEINPDEEVVVEENKEESEEQKEQEIPQEVPEKEHIKLVSIPKDTIDKIVEGSHEVMKKRMQENVVSQEEQIDAVPPGENTQVPFFEDNISNAPLQGSESFNIKKHEYAPYYKHIRNKIRLYWLVQYGTDAAINLVTTDYKPVIVEFQVLSSGKIVSVSISNAAGNDLLASKVQKSVQNTVLDKFPDYVDEKLINVRFNFYFF
ncbi:MAG: hypothetical protein GY941_29805 [Planctomycetes bacterium]|nr:hypothetical protein [Planctomycetota bacterium]